MKILYIAFSCLPDKGSESAIGWNIPMESAMKNETYVITREENREKIEEYLKEHPEIRIRFFYVEIPKWKTRVFRRLWTMQLNALHRKALPLARDLCREHAIGVIHQITPVELRSVGNYGRIPGVKFLCGPLGGGEPIPKGLWAYARGHWTGEILRRWMNEICVRRLKHCGADVFLCANEETAALLKRAGLEPKGPCMSEVGIRREQITEHPGPDQWVFLAVGRLHYRKGHALLLDALARLPEENTFQCWIAGDGPQRRALERRCRKLGLENRVSFLGKVDYRDMPELYGKAAALVLPSLRETTGTVLLEALANSLPVITAKRFGAAAVLEENAGWFYDGSTREEWIQSLLDALKRCQTEWAHKRAAAKNTAMNHTWEAKMAVYQTLYEEAPLVTVIVPVYKTEGYLDRCLESLVRQSYRNLEILLIDDGSPDDCPQMCDGWARRDARVQVIHQKNAGPGMARNTGLDHARGAYLFFVDSDDALEETAVEVCLKAPADVVLFGRKNIAANGKIQCRPADGSKRHFRGGKDILPGLFTYQLGTGVSVCCKMFRRSVVEASEARFWPERETVSEEAFFLLELFPYVETVAVVPETLYRYYENPASLSHTWRQDRQEKNDLFLQKALERCGELGYPPETADHIRARYHTNTLAAMKQMVSASRFSKEAFENLLENPILQGSLTPGAVKLAPWKARIFWRLFQKKWGNICLFLLHMKK